MDWHMYCLKTEADDISEQDADGELVTASSWKHCLTVCLMERLNTFNQISNPRLNHRLSEQQIRFQQPSSSTAFQRAFIKQAVVRSNTGHRGWGYVLEMKLFLSFWLLSQFLPKQHNYKVMYYQYKRSEKQDFWLKHFIKLKLKLNLLSKHHASSKYSVKEMERKSVVTQHSHLMLNDPKLLKLLTDIEFNNRVLPEGERSPRTKQVYNSLLYSNVLKNKNMQNLSMSRTVSSKSSELVYSERCYSLVVNKGLKKEPIVCWAGATVTCDQFTVLGPQHFFSQCWSHV